MGFFKDFKRDFAQAVNELMPDKDELDTEYDDEDMVNTFDENDNMEIAPEDLEDTLESLDDFNISEPIYQTEKPVEETLNRDFEDEEPEEEDALSNIPEAEIINENMDSESVEDVDIVPEEENVPIMTAIEDDKVIAEPEAVPDNLELTEETDKNEILPEDELKGLDELDEQNMQENIDELEKTEPDEAASVDMEADLINVDLGRAVMDAISRQDENAQTEVSETSEASENTEEITMDNEESREDNMADITDVAADLNEDIASKEQDVNSILADDTTYITKSTVIKGNIETDGGIDIIGTVEGDVICGGKLIIGGTIKGNVTAGEIYANAAKIEGEIISDGSIKIGVGSVIIGNVSSTSAVVAGAVNGDIDVHGPVIVDSTAVIMGNIKSRSVQINNGAVIEGFCSQCYSEIDVKSFFE